MKRPDPIAEALDLVGSKLVVEPPLDLRTWSESSECRPLMEALRADEVICENFDSKMHALGLQATRLELCGVAWWLARRASQVGAAKAVEAVRTYLRSPTYEAFVVFLLAGLHLEDRYDLGGGVSLVPPTTLPTDSLRRAVSRNWLNGLPLPAITGALVTKVELHRLVGDEPELSEVDIHDLQEAWLCLYDARLCLSLCRRAGCGVQGIATSAVPADDVPIAFFGTAWNICNFRPSAISAPLIPIEAKHAAKAYKDFSKLEDQQKASLRVPMDKLNVAAASIDLVDRSVALRTALESLFLTSSDRTEMVYRLALRAALYTGGDRENREDIRANITDAYNLSSRAVHEGRLPRKGKLSRDPLGVMKQAAEIARQAVLSRLSSPNVDWNAIELADGISDL